MASSELESRLQCAIVDYLELLSRRHGDEGLEVAVSCVRESFGLVGRPVPLAEGEGDSLLQAFSAGVSQAEAVPFHESPSRESVGMHIEAVEAPHELEPAPRRDGPSFEMFADDLEARGYFSGADGAEYERRARVARSRYLARRHGVPEPAAAASDTSAEGEGAIDHSGTVAELTVRPSRPAGQEGGTASTGCSAGSRGRSSADRGQKPALIRPSLPCRRQASRASPPLGAGPRTSSVGRRWPRCC